MLTQSISSSSPQEGSCVIPLFVEEQGAHVENPGVIAQLLGQYLIASGCSRDVQVLMYWYRAAQRGTKRDADYFVWVRCWLALIVADCKAPGSKAYGLGVSSLVRACRSRFAH